MALTSPSSTYFRPGQCCTVLLQAFSPNEQCQEPDKCPEDGLFNFTVVCGVPPGQQAVVPAVVGLPPQDDSSTTGRSVYLQMDFEWLLLGVIEDRQWLCPGMCTSTRQACSGSSR